MLDFISCFVYCFFHFAPYAVLCFIPFTDTLKVSLKHFYLLSSILLLILTFVLTTLIMIFPADYVDPLFLLFFLIGFLYCILIFDIPKMKVLFVLFMVMNYAVFVNDIALFGEVYFFPETFHIKPFYSGSIFVILIQTITVPFFIRFLLKKIKGIILFKNTTKIWRILWIIPAMFCIISIVYEAIVGAEIMHSIAHAPIVLTLTFGAFPIYFSIVALFKEMVQNVELRENIAIINRQVDIQREQYESLNKSIKTAAVMRHDLRHHLSAIESLLATGKTQELSDYLITYKGSLPTEPLIYCKNTVVNAVICHYLDRAKQKCAKVDIKISVPKKSQIEDTDLCIVFGNCLENAIEAIEKLEEKDRYIKIRSIIVGDMITILIENKFDNILLEKNGKIVSRKINRLGIGLSSVKAVAQKYGGDSKFETEDGIFRSSITLCLTTAEFYCPSRF